MQTLRPWSLLPIGVVIPAYNAHAWIHRCLRSLIGQTYSAWSAVVVDDGSDDATSDEVRQLLSSRIRLIRQANAGVSAARNRGLSALPHVAAVLFLDADDWLAPDALERLAAALRAAPAAVAATGSAAFVDETGRICSVKTAPYGDILARLLVSNVFVNGGHVLIRRDAVTAAGIFLPGLSFGEDWEYWTRLALLGPFAAVSDQSPVLFARRLDSGAYRRMAGTLNSFMPCMDVIFGNPQLRARLGPGRLAQLRARAEAENAWIAGRALLSEGDFVGRKLLRHSVTRAPSPKRLALLAAAHCPPAWRLIAT